MHLLLGCGHARDRKIRIEAGDTWRNLVTLDMNPEVGADVVHDLCDLPLPFADDSAEEIHLYDVLEHTRRQGDWRGFFDEFEEFYRILKPNGLLCALVPRADGVWAWGDPGHTRVIQLETLGFLDQRAYTRECNGGPTATNKTDYRFCYSADFELIWHETRDVQFAFVLRAVKPSRTSR